jgi:hypothetical protein
MVTLRSGLLNPAALQAESCRQSIFLSTTSYFSAKTVCMSSVGAEGRGLCRKRLHIDSSPLGVRSVSRRGRLDGTGGRPQSDAIRREPSGGNPR